MGDFFSSSSHRRIVLNVFCKRMQAIIFIDPDLTDDV